MWNGFGGKPNPSEAIEEAARREVKEEAKVIVERLEKVAEIEFILRAEQMQVTMQVFFATGWENEPEETEEMRPEWFEMDKIPYEQMWQADRDWLPIIFSGKKIKAKYTYEKEGGEVETRELLFIS